jgi:hypothetical protein
LRTSIFHLANAPLCAGLDFSSASLALCDYDPVKRNSQADGINPWLEPDFPRSLTIQRLAPSAVIAL